MGRRRTVQMVGFSLSPLASSLGPTKTMNSPHFQLHLEAPACSSACFQPSTAAPPSFGFCFRTTKSPAWSFPHSSPFPCSALRNISTLQGTAECKIKQHHPGPGNPTPGVSTEQDDSSPACSPYARSLPGRKTATCSQPGTGSLDHGVPYHDSLWSPSKSFLPWGCP